MALTPVGRVARDFERGAAHGDGLAIDRARITQLPRLLDDGAGGELGLRGDVEGVRIGLEELGQLRPEVRDVAPKALRRDHAAAILLELCDGRAPDALGVVGLLGDGGQGADAVGPEHVAGADANFDVADLGAEDVVAGVGDVGIAGQPGEEDHAVSFGQRRDAEHGAAARRPEDDLDPVDVGELVVGVDRVLGVALRVFDDQLQRTPVDAAGGVDLLESHELGLVRHGAVGLAGAGERLHDADAIGSRVVCILAAGHEDRHDTSQES